MIRILICEDEKLISDRLRRFVEYAIDGSISIQQVYALSDALEFLSQNTIDLLFLDLNLHGRDGFELLKKLNAEVFHVIIVSAYVDKAIEAYDYGVLDFLGKPFTQERVQKSINRFQKDHTEPTHHLKYVSVKVRGGHRFIPVTDIRYIKAAGIYSELVSINDQKYVYDKPMNQLLKLLSSRFLRIHKSYVVPINQIISIEKSGINVYEVVLKNERRVPCSRKMRKEILEKLSSITS